MTCRSLRRWLSLSAVRLGQTSVGAPPRRPRGNSIATSFRAGIDARNGASSRVATSKPCAVSSRPSRAPLIVSEGCGEIEWQRPTCGACRNRVTACLSELPTMSIGLDGLDQRRGQFDLGVPAACICAAAGDVDPMSASRASWRSSRPAKSGASNFGAMATTNSPAPGVSAPLTNEGASSDQFAPVRPAARTSTISAIFAPRDPPNVSSAPFTAA